jgi:SAM-dependent methyltransferase
VSRRAAEGRLTPAEVVATIVPWTGVAEPIYRRVARLADAAPGRETLWVGCGTGRSVLWWAERFRTRTEGVDVNEAAIEAAEQAARRAGLQEASPTDLPHEPQVFDLTVVNALQLGVVDGGGAVRQAARVVRPMGTVVGIVPTWLSTPSAVEERLLTDLGVRPHLLVEWKGMFRDAGIVELRVEDAALEGRWISPGWVGILVRAWRVAGWRGLRAVIARPFRVFRQLVTRRTVGLSLIKGTRWPHA